MKPTKCSKTAGLKSLAEYIQEHYNGNQSEFGRSQGLMRAQVYQYLNAKKPVYVVCNKLVQVIRDLD